MKALGLFLVLAGTGIAMANDAQDNPVEWLGSYREALRQAKETRKPIFVEFRCEA
jgi:uncharacterized protein YyaL (SSP411 family)